MASARAEARAAKEMAELFTERTRTAYIEKRRHYESQTQFKKQDWFKTFQPPAWWDGKAKRRFSDHAPPMPLWPKFAKSLFERHLDPVEYVQQVFIVASMSSQIIEPGLMTSDKAFGMYWRYQDLELSVGDARQDMISQQRTLDSRIMTLRAQPGWTAERMKVAILRDDNLQLSALFRSCTAKRHGLPGVAAFYWRLSLFQYFLGMDAYDEAWGDFIPIEFREEARRYYTAILAELTARTDKSKWRNGEYFDDLDVQDV
jgi:hypothetical protein